MCGMIGDGAVCGMIGAAVNAAAATTARMKRFTYLSSGRS